MGLEIPAFVFIAGPNGSGKSTAVDEYVRARFGHLPHRCADNYVRQWRALNTFPGDTPRELSIRAANKVDAHVRAFVNTATPFLVETVLSSGKYRPEVEKARYLGLLFWLVYVTTLDPELNVARVWDRVQAGGHDVPAPSVRDRWHKSMAELPWFAARADKLVVVDNSTDNLTVLALRRYGRPLEFTGEMPDHPALKQLASLRGKLVEAPKR